MKTTEFTVVHTIPATQGEVFDHWMDPTRAGRPWVGEGERSLNPVVGGSFYWSDRNFSDLERGREWAHYGRFLRIARPDLIEYTWVSEFTEGLDSIITVTFLPTGTEQK